VQTNASPPVRVPVPSRYRSKRMSLDPIVSLYPRLKPLEGHAKGTSEAKSLRVVGSIEKQRDVVDQDVVFTSVFEVTCILRVR